MGEGRTVAVGKGPGRERLAVALDVPDAPAARKLAETLHGRAGWLKVGLELFVSAGPAALDAVRGHGRLFLDLKLHDIPNTVAGAVRAAARHEVDLLTVHASGGPSMMRAAAEAARAAEEETGRRPRLLGVTVLTSLAEAELARLGISGAPEDHVLRLSELALEAGLDGVVASPREVAALRRRLGEDALLVTPGIRAAGDATGDQARVATPGQAIRAGADLLVVGRPIVRAPDPAATADRVVHAIEQALGGAAG